MARGRWIPANAAVRSTSPRRPRTAVSSGSANGPARSSASWTRRPSCAEVNDGLLGERVDGVDPAGRRTVVVARRLVGTAQHLDGRVDHLEGAPEGRHGSEEQGQGAGRQLPGPPGLVEEHRPEPAAGVGHLDLHPGRCAASPAGARRRGADPAHGGQHRGLLPLGEPVDGDHAGAVDVPARIVGDQVEDARDVELGQVPGHGVADPPQHGDVQLGQLSESASRGSGPGTGGRCRLPSLDGEQVRVQGLAAVVDLGLHHRTGLLQPLGDAAGVGRP